ncbi:MAG: biotin synthase [Candidatus Deianiraeaceae bacterium]|jgi:biotin synthase
MKQWTIDEALTLSKIPLFDLIFQARNVHAQHHNAQEVEIATLCSIKTGSCPEDCKYCPQSAHYNTGLKKEPLMDKEEILSNAKKAQETGATRFCMGAAWRKLHKKDTEYMCDIISSVKALGIETCATFGTLDAEQAVSMKDAGLDYYNHNLDTSEEFYSKIITTRPYQERLDTLKYVADAGINICCGGIVGMGETFEDRLKMMITLSNLEKQPDSIPINMLVKVKGTPLENAKNIDSFEYIRLVAITRIMFPKAFVRLSAGRVNMSEEMQAMCFMSGANSIFYGDKLLTTENNDSNTDLELLKRLDLKQMKKPLNNQLESNH